MIDLKRTVLAQSKMYTEEFCIDAYEDTEVKVPEELFFNLRQMLLSGKLTAHEWTVRIEVVVSPKEKA